MPVTRAVERAVLVGIIALVAIACSSPARAERGSPEPAGTSGPLEVVVTMSILGDFVRSIGADHVVVTSVVEVGGDPHVHEPRPSDSRRIADADLVIANGLGLSPWFESLRVNATRTVEATATLTDEAVDSEGEPDPHLWMDPTLVIEGYVPVIRDALIEADPAHAEDYRANAAAFVVELEALDDMLGASFDELDPSRRKLVTSHDAYGYFARRFGLEVVGTVIGVSTEDEPSARHVQELIDRIRAERVPAIFVETTINPSIIERVAADAGTTLGSPLYGDSVGLAGSGAETYATMMQANAAAIVEGLGRDWDGS